MSSEVHLFIGSRNRTDDRLVPGAGIGVWRFDEESLAAEPLALAEDIDNPSYLAVDAAARRLYAVSEVAAWAEGTVSAYALGADGRLAYLNKQPSLGRSPCHLAFVGKDVLAVANYADGRSGPDRAVALYRIAADGSLAPPFAAAVHSGPTGPRADRQERSHAHCVTPLPRSGLVLVADLGTDEIVAYRLAGDTFARAFAWRGTPGAGPRHIVAHPDGRHVYLVNEIASTLTVLSVSERGLDRVDELSTLPAGFAAQAWAAGIALSPDARHLYVSNRVHDSIAHFALADDGGAAFLGTTPCGGAWPRSFALTPSGRHLLVANQNSDAVAVFARDGETGALAPTGAGFAVPAPLCIRAAALA